ncbi:unnamed protein product [Phyllotreta striolata]|uniref:Uncharacterized protein n=1 Tax=Phyllotreta striolata TaxID=444603 RepID=A0A9N9XV25_PHYSR|nr:unnamed protein product [Phyllotreta striolata]
MPLYPRINGTREHPRTGCYATGQLCELATNLCSNNLTVMRM